MLFNDYPFLLVFLPAALLVYRLADPHPPARIGVLVLLSLAFYGYGNPSFVLLLVASIAINWLAAQAYGRIKTGAIITAAIVLNLAVLGALQIRQFPCLQSRLAAGPADADARYRDCRSASPSSPSTTSCIWST